MQRESLDPLQVAAYKRRIMFAALITNLKVTFKRMPWHRAEALRFV